MFTRLATLRTIEDSGAVLIVRLPDADSAERVAHAAVDGGFRDRLRRTVRSEQ
jgi:2-dehydro-3-deoxyphosphogluconate aldolase/(4S)-4-hydroxy-2-oxoglutarate aldolase